MPTPSWGTSTAGANVFGTVRPGNNDVSGGFWEFDLENPAGSSPSQTGQHTWGGTGGVVNNGPNGTTVNFTADTSNAVFTVGAEGSLVITPTAFSYITQVGVYAWVDASSKALSEQVTWSGLTVTFYDADDLPQPYTVPPDFQPGGNYLKRIKISLDARAKAKPKGLPGKAGVARAGRIVRGPGITSAKNVNVSLGSPVHSELLIVTPDDHLQVRVAIGGNVGLYASAKTPPVAAQAVMGKILVWTA